VLPKGKIGPSVLMALRVLFASEEEFSQWDSLQGQASYLLCPHPQKLSVVEGSCIVQGSLHGAGQYAWFRAACMVQGSTRDAGQHVSHEPECKMLTIIQYCCPSVTLNVTLNASSWPSSSHQVVAIKRSPSSHRVVIKH